MPEKRPLTTIEGIVLPADWDAEGRVTAVAVSTRDEQEFRARGRKSQGLFQHLRQTVVVRGYMEEDSEQRPAIRVESFHRKPGGDATA